MATDSTRKDNKNTRKKDWEPIGPYTGEEPE